MDIRVSIASSCRCCTKYNQHCVRSVSVSQAHSVPWTPLLHAEVSAYASNTADACVSHAYKPLEWVVVYTSGSLSATNATAPSARTGCRAYIQVFDADGRKLSSESMCTLRGYPRAYNDADMFSVVLQGVPDADVHKHVRVHVTSRDELCIRYTKPFFQTCDARLDGLLLLYRGEVLFQRESKVIPAWLETAVYVTELQEPVVDGARSLRVDIQPIAGIETTVSTVQSIDRVNL
jgi:hypothetical protein